ncbi:MAG: hypothetical protein NTZ53_09335 [Cyanobacteria bacterium]|nr:hypothetical protein [Cyanobacteriota bacterium]
MLFAERNSSESSSIAWEKNFPRQWLARQRLRASLMRLVSTKPIVYLSLIHLALKNLIAAHIGHRGQSVSQCSPRRHHQNRSHNRPLVGLCAAAAGASPLIESLDQGPIDAAYE